MMKTNTQGFIRNSTQERVRPKTSISKRTIDFYTSGEPLHRRIRHAYQISSITDMNKGSRYKGNNLNENENKIDSDQPETVCSWLDQFQDSIAHKTIGTPYQYPASKYEQSAKLRDSNGYRKVKNMQKQQKLPQFVKVMRQELRKIHFKMDLTEEAKIIQSRQKN